MNSSQEEGDGAKAAGSPRPMRKTPMFTARNASRYGRQDLIREIDGIEGSSLICYVAGDETEFEPDDTLGLVDLLHNIEPGVPVDLMLHTCGGQVDTCENLIRILQAHVGDGRFRVIVPEKAKSSGTILALAADEIIMSATSELGMIDPMYDMKDHQGTVFAQSVVVYLRTFDQYAGLLSGNARNTLAEQMLMDFDAKVVAKFRGIETRVRNLAEGLLKRKGNPGYTSITRELLNSEVWRTHYQPIGADDATLLGLPVKTYSMQDPKWQRYWALYCLQREEIGRRGKMFESAFVSQMLTRPADVAED